MSTFQKVIKYLALAFALFLVVSIFTGKVDFTNWFIALDGGSYATLEAAQEAGAIDGVTHAKLAEILPQYGSMNKSTFNRWIKTDAVGTHPYAGHSAFQNMVADFRKLMEE